jgi:hypothetical protein
MSNKKKRTKGRGGAMDKPPWVFWEEYKKSGKRWPPFGDCPRCGQPMTSGGFWMFHGSEIMV